MSTRAIGTVSCALLAVFLGGCGGEYLPGGGTPRSAASIDPATEYSFVARSATFNQGRSLPERFLATGVCSDAPGNECELVMRAWLDGKETNSRQIRTKGSVITWNEILFNAPLGSFFPELNGERVDPRDSSRGVWVQVLDRDPGLLDGNDDKFTNKMRLSLPWDFDPEVETFEVKVQIDDKPHEASGSLWVEQMVFQFTPRGPVTMGPLPD